MKKNKKDKKELSYRTKYTLFRGGSILTTITPLAVVVLINRKAYFTIQHKTVLDTGLIIALVFMAITLAFKLKITKLLWLTIFVGIAIFFENVFKDIKMLSVALWIGGVIDRFVFYGKVKRYEMLANEEDKAKVNAKEQKKVNEELVKTIVDVIDRGRV